MGTWWAVNQKTWPISTGSNLVNNGVTAMAVKDWRE